VIPANSPIALELIVGPFYSAVRQSQIVSNAETRGVDFTLSNGTLRLTSRAADVGESNVEIAAPYDGEELTVSFEPRYVAEFLKVLEGDQTVTVKLSDSESAALFRAGDSWQYVVMPLSRD